MRGLISSFSCAALVKVFFITHASSLCPERGQKEKRIVDGTEITPGSWPWLVALGRTGTDDVRFIHCGATLYDSKHIITAQHCIRETPELTPIPMSSMYAVVGEHTLNMVDGTEQERTIQNAFICGDYNKETQDHDIAVLVLNSTVRLTPGQAEPLPLNTDHSCPETGQVCNIAGWGKTAVDSSRSVVPLEAGVTVVSNEACGQLYGTDMPPNKLCAGTGGADACTGDSGCALVCQCGGRRVLAGVASYGRACGSASHPGVYTRVSEYVDWITDTVFAFSAV